MSDANVLRRRSRGATRLVAKPGEADRGPQSLGCALITGASRGIGAATARALAADGWSVGINYSRDRDGAEAVAASIEEAGGRALPVAADVADGSAADEMLARLAEELGPVLVLVNNAGLTADNLSMRLSDEDWRRVLDVNLTGAFRLTRAALGPMMRQRFGRVINVSSVVGLRANPGQANYAASKAGLIALTRTVAAEVARRGVTVNAVAPGLIETALTRDFTGNGSDSNGSSQLLDAIPARRTGTPEEVAAAIRFLASDEAAYVTGAVLPIDGGMSA
ncbi:MAG TPA: 3-oxoacyl-[acyl-carrier-protein] reductase [Solirubrobacterales bacterium]|nr:3-oxoacyl-[acyl-carrier-protein] reductase [Solirubrobacterales bacterium]